MNRITGDWFKIKLYHPSPQVIINHHLHYIFSTVQQVQPSTKRYQNEAPETKLSTPTQTSPKTKKKFFFFLVNDRKRANEDYEWVRF